MLDYLNPDAPITFGNVLQDNLLDIDSDEGTPSMSKYLASLPSGALNIPAIDEQAEDLNPTTDPDASFNKLADNAKFVESCLITALSTGNLVNVIAVALPHTASRRAVLKDNVTQEEYAMAVEFNPAIRMYAHLARHLDSDTMKEEKGSLTIQVTSKQYVKLIAPKLHDIDLSLSPISPIVSVVAELAQGFKVKSETLGRKKGDLAYSKDETPEDDFDLQQVEMDSLLTDEATLTINDTPGFGIEDIVETTNPPLLKEQVSRSSSNKKIAQHYMTHKFSRASAKKELTAKGFERDRIVSIVGQIIQPTAPLSTTGQIGNTEFEFTF